MATRLFERDAVLAAVIGSSLDGVVVVDTDSEVLEWNPAAEEMFGWSREEAVGRSLADLIIPPEHHDGHRTGMARYLGGAEPQVLGKRIEVPARCKDRRIIPVELSITEVLVDGQRLFTASLRDLTELKQARVELERSEARLNAFFENAPVAMFLLKADGTYERVNDIVAQSLNTTPQAMVGKRPTDVVSEKDARAVVDALRQVVSTGEPHTTEQSYALPIGDVHALISHFPIRAEDGRITHTGTVAVDITARVSAERALRDSEARMTAFLDHAPMAMYLKDRAGRYFIANRFMAERLGRTVEELKTLTPRDVLSPASWAESQEVDAAIIASRAPHVRESEFMTSEGLYSALTIRFPVFDEAGEIAYIGGVILDTSEAKQFERRLIESEARLQAFIQNAPVTMFVKDRDGRYLLANEETARHLGTSVEAMIGRTAAEIAPPEVAAAGAQAEAEVLRTGRAQTETQAFDLPSGRVHGLNTRFPIPDAGGELTQVGGVFVDITAQKEAEEELQRSREALLQSEKMNALGSLLAGVSHELNNPLAIVVGEAVLLQEEAEGTDFETSAARIQRAAERCSRIVQTFLAMARQKAPERKPVDLTGLVQGAIELADYGLRSNGVEVIRDFAPGLPPVSADADQVTQVVLNLLVNAQQALQDQPLPRCLTVRIMQAANSRLAIEVEDNGPGVPEGLVRRIFDPFFTTKPQGTGTGIGLSFSQGIAEAHGGSLTLMPSAKGATFRLEIPVAPAPEAATDGAKEEIAPSQRRALVVDDEPELAETLARMLRRQGLEAEVAVGGLAGRERLRTGQYDVVLSDLRMPDFDGPSLYGWILEERPELASRIGFVTGDTLGPAAVQFLQECGCPYLEKPFTRETVRGLLARLAGPESEAA